MNSNKVSTSEVLSRICSFVFSNSRVQGGRFQKLKGVNHLAMQKTPKNNKKPPNLKNGKEMMDATLMGGCSVLDCTCSRETCS